MITSNSIRPLAIREAPGGISTLALTVSFRNRLEQVPIYEAKGFNDCNPNRKVPTMSPNVGNFVHDLVEMAKAMETLPQVQAELEQTKELLNKEGETVARREIHILELKGVIDELNSKLREAEVAKDAAETMFLEADDRASRALDFIKATFGNAGSLIQALEPPKPAPAEVPVQAMPEAAPVAENVGQSASSPTAPTAALSTDSISSNPVEPVAVTTTAESSQGQSESPLPSPHASAAPTTVASSPVETPVSASSPSSIDPGPAIGEAKPYAGKNWNDVEPRVWSHQAWIDGGGSDEGWIA